MKNLLYIGNKLSSHGFSVTTIETLGPLLEKEGYKVHYASSKQNTFMRMLDMLIKVLKLSPKIDLIIIDTYSTTNFWYAFLVSQLARILKIRYVPILHGGNLPQRLKNNPRCSKMLFHNAYVNVAPSQYLLHHFELHGFRNIVFIPNTIEIENYPFKQRDAIEPRLLWVRSFAQIYNPNMAIEVYQKVRERYPKATLCMVGQDKDGSLQEAKEKAEAYQLEVTFTGRLSKKEWIELSSDYAVFINTSHFDNTPVSVIEAMALGLPVVSTRVGGIPYLLEDKENALLIADNAVQEMVDAIFSLCENPSLVADLSEKARHKAATFDWKQAKTAWKDII